MRNVALCFVSQLALIIAACTPEVPAGEAVQTTAPVMGKADSTDKADHQCQIVLRSISRQPGTNGYKTQCTAGVCNWVWEGSVEVTDQVKGGVVRVLYHLAGDPKWWQVDTTPAASSQPGFVRHEFAIHEHLIGPSASEAELAAAKIELMPFVELPDGTRIFDHNRRPGDFDNYVLDQQSYFGVPDDYNTCAPVAGRISYFSNWDEYFGGTLRQDGYLVISYALDRLPKCRGPAWDTVAHLRFSPGGQLASGSVRTFDSANVAQSKELVVKIPSDAASVEIWFHNFTGSCEAWDSNFGANYRHDIWPPVDDPRCKDIERWTSINSDMPYASKPHCLAYTVDQNHDASHCEFYLDGIGDGYMGHYGIPNNWVEAYITVGPQLGTLLGAGMFTRYKDTATGTTGERFTFGQSVAPGAWQTGFIYLKPGIMGSQGYKHTVQQMAFFIDVKRPTGEVVRLWQSHHGANYGWADAFSLPTSTKYIAYGSIKYAGGGSAVFDAKQTCKQ